MVFCVDGERTVDIFVFQDALNYVLKKGFGLEYANCFRLMRDSACFCYKVFSTAFDTAAFSSTRLHSLLWRTPFANASSIVPSICWRSTVERCSAWKSIILRLIIDCTLAPLSTRSAAIFALTSWQISRVYPCFLSVLSSVSAWPSDCAAAPASATYRLTRRIQFQTVYDGASARISDCRYLLLLVLFCCQGVHGWPRKMADSRHARDVLDSQTW